MGVLDELLDLLQDLWRRWRREHVPELAPVPVPGRRLPPANLRAIAPLLVALLAASGAARAADALSTSVMHPTQVPQSGVIAAPFAGAETRYYFALDVQPGDLLTQISFTGKAGSDKQLTLEVLDASARVKDSYWVHGGDASGQSTRSFPIDASGHQVLRVIAKGPETSQFCIEIGGKAYPTAGGTGCPGAASDSGATAAAAAAPAPVAEAAPAKIEVIDSKCEERLRIGSDVFFDFDSATLRVEAAPTLSEVGRRLAQGKQPVAIEGHTDGKGTDEYNQKLSEQRATSVRAYLVDHGTAGSRLTVVGYGKKHPVAPNEHGDGSDDPDGRQKNRRVEIVINTCA
jgi:outer membrane protein OmpA-like peptidoglycan-associated protein